MDNTWADGYITEVPYTTAYYTDQSPVLHRLVCVLAGIVPPEIAPGFQYCELGCGNGLSLALLAEAFPMGQFHGADFNPTHIGFATKFARDGGIHNVHFYDASFEEFIDVDLPQFDFIALHGVYSWISPVQRQHIVRFIKKKLKVGGVVYNSYNAMPGKMALEPVRRILKEVASDPSGSVNQVEQGLKLLEALIENPTGVFRIIGGKELIERFKHQPREYLVHEFLHDTWTNFYCTDVFREMAEAKLTYVGSTSMAMNFDPMSVPRAHYQAYQNLKTLEQKQLFKDLLINTPFRRDVYVRGPIQISPGQQKAIWDKTYLGKTPFFNQFQSKYRCPAGEVDLSREKEAIGQLFEMLAREVMSLEQLVRQNVLNVAPPRKVEFLRHLLAANQITGFARPAEPDHSNHSISRYNQYCIRTAVEEGRGGWLTSRVYGNSVFLNHWQMLILKGWLQTRDTELCYGAAADELIQRGIGIQTPNGQIRQRHELVDHLSRQHKDTFPGIINELKRLEIV